ncbi:hypothetical protein [Bacillus sp. MUM 13]|uniref:hypothetical protein n=1 Tax=Bacillus sp. MUM 13 TaxID=1678001 RepID=UPI0008F56623|nr:hypothetical protein [Bacillus sp. MUM 13]OIK03932.1 hypothetical protein BIV59_22370 [Bacillus sp. MUM 13]
MIKGKITPGRGFQYTPQNSIPWAEEFNDLLEHFSSRNELMSKLIEDGIKVQNGIHKEKGIYLPMDWFSNDQLMLLKTDEGKKILYNILSLVLGNPGSRNLAQAIAGSEPYLGETLQTEDAKPEKASDSAQDIKSIRKEKTPLNNQGDDALSRLIKIGNMTNFKR